MRTWIRAAVLMMGALLLAGSCVLAGKAQTEPAAVQDRQAKKQQGENGGQWEDAGYQAGEVLVTFPYGTEQEEIESVIMDNAAGYDIIDSGELEIDESLPEEKKQRLAKARDYKTDIVVLAELRPGDTVEDAKERFGQYDCVLEASENVFLEANGKARISLKNTKDTYFKKDRKWNTKLMKLSKAHAKLRKMKSLNEVWVAVIDCGVQMKQADLKGRLLTQYSVDVTNGNKKLTSRPDKASRYGQYTGAHGTMLAGIIAAKPDKKQGMTGITTIAGISTAKPICRIMAIKCDTTVDSGGNITQAYLAKGINYAVAKGADIINISYSVPKGKYSKKNFSSIENAIKRAVAANVCVIASAGNDGGSTPRYPAAYDGVIGVGAAGTDGRVADYSNRSSAVDIVAPGGGYDTKLILSTCPTTIRKNGFKSGRGTSYAAPQAAGVVALMKSVNYDLTPEEIQALLQKGSGKAKDKKTKKTYRMIDAEQAVIWAQWSKGCKGDIIQQLKKER